VGLGLLLGQLLERVGEGGAAQFVEHLALCF
jgi:hypothetical protein